MEDYINSVFPDAESLKDIDNFALSIKKNIKKLDDEIKKTMMNQHDVTDEINNAKKIIDELSTRIEKMDSETVPVIIEAKKLIQVKKNFVSAITVMQRLKMITTIIENPNEDSIVALDQLLLQFVPYKNVGHIQQIFTDAEKAKNDLGDKIFNEFRENISGNVGRVCKIASALHIEDRFKKYYCDMIINDYKKQFNIGTEPGAVEHIGLRFKWLMQKNINKTLPTEWDIDGKIKMMFNEETMLQLSILLPKTNPDIILKVMQKPECCDLLASFEPYFHLYIKVEDDAINELFKKFSDTMDYNVLPSSSMMFVFFKKSYKRCSSIKSNLLMVMLSRVFAKYLDRYGERFKNNEHDMKKICMNLNTINYCYETIKEMETKMGVDFSGQQEIYSSLMRMNTHFLVDSVMAKMRVPLDRMVKVEWKKIVLVGDHSDYVSDILRIFSESIIIIGETIIRKQDFKNYCMKIIDAFVNNFMISINKCKIKSGGEQLLLDVQTIKSHIIQITDIKQNMILKQFETVEKNVKNIIINH